MSKKFGFYFLKIILCFALGAMIFAFFSCTKDQPAIYRAASHGISADDFYPSWSPDGTKIVFCSDRDGNLEIYVMNTDGSNPTRLTHNLTSESNPFVSPDGQRIAFDSERDGNGEIYIMNTDGSEQIRLTKNPAADFFPSWSPDGQKILFTSARDGNAEIYTMDVDGSNKTRLTANERFDGLPFWSPDGRKISFSSARDGNAEIYIMNADGSDQTRLTDNPAEDIYSSWSPDGSSVVFQTNRDGNREIYTIKTDGSDTKRLTNEPAKDIIPSWSPDGQRIAFVSERDFSNEVYVMDVDGSHVVRLTHNTPVNATSGLAPVPQSELNLDEIPYRLVFKSRRETDRKENWEICLIDVDGSNFVNLTNTPDIDEEYPQASPDGRTICFEAVELGDEASKSRDVYTMSIDGTGKTKIAENAYQPCWSADGRYLAYLPGEYPRYNPRVAANRGLEIYELETKETKRHPNDKIIHHSELCWSPDGEWFVVEGGRITAYKADDKTMMFLNAPGCTPDISPTGQWLAWNGSDFSLNIGSLDFDSPQSNVTDHRMVVACNRDHWIYDSAWSPDEKYLAFSYGIEEKNENENTPKPWINICICDLETGKWTQVPTNGIYNAQPDWVPMQVR